MRRLQPVCKRRHGAGLQGSEGVQIVELALVLPLLMILLVGIFDFGNAFNLKQKLTSAARAAARFGSDSPTNDLNAGGTPTSITSIRNLVDDYLVAANMNDCGLVRTVGAQSPPQLEWTYSAAGNGCPGTLTLTIDRSNAVPATVGGQPVQVISTHIRISYPYQWQFGSVFSLVSPGANFANGVTQIATDVYVPNLD
jgi:Flp pilus assembly protein TadG